MKPRLILVLLLIVLTPLAIVGWLGAKITADEQSVVDFQFQELMRGQLRAVDAAIAASLDSYQQQVLDQMRPFTTNREQLRRRSRESPLVVQMFVLNSEGQLQHPPVDIPPDLTLEERESLQRTAQIWDGGDLITSAGEAEATAASGWKAWFWGNGLQMMLWARDGQQIHAAEINRTRLLADLIGALPETDAIAPELSGGRIRLQDATGSVLYQWGFIANEESAIPAARLPLRAPLNAWTLEYVRSGGSSPGSLPAGSFLVVFLPSLAILALIIFALAWYFYREQSREMRDAALRVSFVNQVSHELKTPLTNIRMYAELLEKQFSDADPKNARYVGVIVAESQRLSRLIANVLTFSRNQRQTLDLRFEESIPDEVLRTTVEQFRPSLEARGIDVELNLHTSEPCVFDPDALGQIGGNLLSNVEKYAASGGFLRVASRLERGLLEVVVEDRGPGILARDRERIFEPFYRVHNSLTEGVSGTGIGLSISRDLARLHGGDLQLDTDTRSPVGARFRITLPCRAAVHASNANAGDLL